MGVKLWWRGCWQLEPTVHYIASHAGVVSLAIASSKKLNSIRIKQKENDSIDFFLHFFVPLISIWTCVWTTSVSSSPSADGITCESEGNVIELYVDNPEFELFRSVETHVCQFLHSAPHLGKPSIRPSTSKILTRVLFRFRRAF